MVSRAVQFRFTLILTQYTCPSQSASQRGKRCLFLLYMKGAKNLFEKRICMLCFSVTRPLSATPRWEFVVPTNSTKVLHTNSTKVVHTNTNSTKVVHMDSVHGKVVTDSGLATNSTCVSGAPCSRLNSRK